MNTANNTGSDLYLALIYVRPLLDYLKSLDISIQPLLDVLGLELADLKNSDQMIADSKMNELFAMAESLSNDSSIGLHAGLQMRTVHLGIVGMLVLTCKDAAEAIDLVGRYQDLLGNGGHLRWEFKEPLCEWQFIEHEARKLDPYSRHNIEFSFAAWVSMARAVLGADLNPQKVCFRCAPPDNTAEQERLFRCELEYNAPSNSILFPSAWLERPLLVAEPDFQTVLETRARERLQVLRGQQTDNAPVVASTKQTIAELLAFGVPSIDEVAKRANVSARTLQRQLEAAGHSYKKLLDEVRAELSRQLIANPELSLFEVALMAGFSEQSSFQRAFKRWFEHTPGEYRRRGLNTGAM